MARDVAMTERRTLVSKPRFISAAAVRPMATVALIALLCFLTVYPMLMLLYGAFASEPPGVAGSFNLAGFRHLLEARTWSILWTTVALSLVKTVLSLVVAIGLAWIIARTDTPFRRTLEVLITLPFFIPQILTAMAWGLLGNPKAGSLNQLWRWLTGSPDALINVYSYGGVVWHLMQYTVPFLFLLIVESFRSMDPSLEEASRISGASRLRTFFGVTLMLSLPVLSSAFLLSFIKGMEAFESPMIFGVPAGIQVVTTEIYQSINQVARADYQYASALSFSVLAMLCILIVLQWKLLGNRSFQTVSGKAYRPALVQLGHWKWATFAICLLFFVATVLLPVGQLALGSVFRFAGFYQLKMLTLDHWTAVLGDDAIWQSFANTMLLAVGGATATAALGSVIAYISIRTRWPGRRIIELLAWIPWLFPGIVLGVGFLWAYAFLPWPFDIYGTLWALFFAYIALATPLSVRIMSAAFQQLSYDLEEASRTSGASWWTTFRRILLALVWPSFSVGWVLTFFMVLRELSASVMLYSANSEVLSVTMLKLWSNGKSEEVSAIALLMLGLVVVFRLLQLWLGNRELTGRR
ncbi:ABC transporter permease [Bradyrhizobium sp. HKCCYLR20261]|uniref:ABC transporter permease n=1 Tax=Bradyrhizobium sp. HKCCYLR20261 TaxID=3420760 RepID=UPI003EB9402B